jgi:DNA repair exonuclease SbcCD ATPase subunit
MKKISKDQIKRRDELQGKLQSLMADLETACEAYNEALREKWSAIDDALGAYNEAIGEVNEWQQEIASDIQSYMDDRSEKWLESDKAQEYESWREEFEDEIEEVKLEQPEELGTSDLEDLSEALGNRREELES